MAVAYGSAYITPTLTVNGSTLVSGNITWTPPTLPAGSTIDSTYISGTNNVVFSNTGTSTVAGVTVSPGTAFNLSLGTSLLSSVEVTVRGQNKSTTGSATYINIVYTVNYTLPLVYHTLTINYKDTLGDAVATAHSSQVAEGAGYNIASPDVAGYRPDQTFISGTMGATDVTIDVVYTILYTLTINYKDTLENTIATTHSSQVAEGAEYSITSPTVSDYTPNQSTVSGTMGATDVNVDVIYTSNSPYTLIASYPFMNHGGNGFGDIVGGQTFTTPSIIYDLKSCQFLLRQYELIDPSDTMLYAKLYAITGTSGDGAIPTGSPLATSTGILLSTLPETYSKVSFTFPTPYTMAENTSYCITVGHAATITGYVLIGSDTTVPSHSGNMVAADSGLSNWQANWAADLPFEVFGEIPPTPHTLTINYKYTNETTAATSHVSYLNEGDPYSVTSPTIANYTPDQAVVSGTMGANDITIDVYYTAGLCELTLTPDATKISGSGTSTIGVVSNVHMSAIEARATLEGEPFGRGIGVNVLSDDVTVDAAGVHIFTIPPYEWTFDVSYSEINTDGNYRITVYAQNIDGVWNVTSYPHVTDGLLHYFNALGYRDNIKIWEDLSGNNHDTTISVFNTDGSSGWTDEGVFFDGYDDNFIITGYQPFVTDGSFTVELYLKSVNYTQTQRVLGFGDDTGRFYVQFSTAGITLAVGTSSFVIGDASVFPSIDEMAHFVIVRNGTAFQLWINDVMVNSGIATLKANTSLGRGYVIGTNYDQDYSSFYGTMVLHRFYNRPLSMEEIAQNYVNAQNLTVPYPPPASAIITYTTKRLKNFLCYYGYPTSINGSSGSVSAATTVFANYDMIVFGDALTDTAHPDHYNTISIITNLKGLNANVEIFGYVPMGRATPVLTEQEIKDKVDVWLSMGATGILLDQFGFDYRCTRNWQNLCVDYCHSKGMNVIANSWLIDYTFTKENYYVSWLDFYGNPDNLEPSVGANDYILFEHMFYKYDTTLSVQEVTRTTRVYDAYYYNIAVHPLYDNQTYRERFGTKTIALDSIDDNSHYFAISYLGAKLFNMDLHGAAYRYWSNSTVIVYDTPTLTIENISLPALMKDTYNSIRNAQYTAGDLQLIWQTLIADEDCLATEGTQKFLYNSVEIDTLSDLAVT